jgi:hypothetical protein
MPPPPVPWSPTQVDAGSLHLFDNITDQFMNVLGEDDQAFPPDDFPLDMSFLPISPQSLMFPQPGELDSASDGSPAGRWAWVSGLDGLWDPRANEPWLDLKGGVDHNQALQLDLAAPKPDLNGIYEGTSSAKTQSTSSQSGLAQHIRPSVDQAQRTTGPPRTYPVSGHYNRNSVPPVPPTAHGEHAASKAGRLEDIAPLCTITRILQGYYAHL